MKAIHTLERPAPFSVFGDAMRRIWLAGICLALAACGGSADAPPPPETAPIVVTQPADQSVVEGTAATFGVTAEGVTPLAFQWSSSADGVTFTAIAGATSTTYTTGATGKAPRWRELPTVAARETEAADSEGAAELGAERRRIAAFEVARVEPDCLHVRRLGDLVAGKELPMGAVAVARERDDAVDAAPVDARADTDREVARKGTPRTRQRRRGD